jgi:multimeric flavodoxin WrbA
MRKKILIAKGSPRKAGNSSLLADQAAAGARAAGAEVEVIFLHDLNIQACSGCDSCHVNEDEGCNEQDDMRELYPKLRQADGIILASPIYWFTLSAQTKLFIDRWYALEGQKGSALRGKQFGFLFVYGDTDLHTSGGINAVRTCEDMCRYLKAPIAGFVHGSASDPGDIAKNEAVMAQAYKLGEAMAR